MEGLEDLLSFPFKEMLAFLILFFQKELECLSLKYHHTWYNFSLLFLHQVKNTLQIIFLSLDFLSLRFFQTQIWSLY